MRPLSPGIRDRDPADAGDFGTLLEELRPQLNHLVRRMCPSEADAEDVLQDVYLGMVRTTDRFDDTRSFQAWVNGIARHKILNSRRKAGRCVPLEVELIDFAAGPHEELESEELWRVVLRAVGQLPASYRHVIELHHVDGLPLRDVARLLGRELSTVRTQRRRAVCLLRRALPAGLCA